MDEFSKVLIVAVIVERFTEWLKRIFGDALPEKVGHVSISLILAFIISLGLVFSTSINIFSEVGITFNNYTVDLILTAWLISGGSNYIFDFLKRIKTPTTNEVDVEITEK